MTVEAVADRYPTRTGPPVRAFPRRDPVVHSSESGPLDPDDLRRFGRDGYLVREQLLDEATVDRLRDEAERMAADPELAASDRVVGEPGGEAVRSVFEVHRLSSLMAQVVADERLAGAARQVLGSAVYVHQSRVNRKPGFIGQGFAWHSDFETWHAEDGLPNMRTVSVSIALTENYDTNGGLMIMPGSHRTFLGCAGATPEDNYKKSLQMQDAGLPSDEALSKFADAHGIQLFTGKPGSATWFDCNAMHGSGDNITPYPRSNVFIVFNSVENKAVEPFAAPVARPDFIGARDFTPVQ